MGWFYDHRPGHEGFVRGFIYDGGFWRPLGRFETPGYVGRVHAVAAECECGWRSGRFHAPHRAEYAPHIVHLNDRELDDALHELWLRHMDELSEQRPIPCLLERAVVTT